MPESPTAAVIDGATSTPAPTSSSADVIIAEPSTAKPQIEGSQQKSMVDVVTAALGQRPGTPPKPENSSDPAKPATDASKNPEDLTPEEIAQLSVKGQLRFRHLSNSNKSLQEQLDLANGKLTGHNEFQLAMQKNRVSPEDAKSTFEIMGLMRTDPTEALNRLYPIVTELLKAAGVTLPEDLQREVDANKLSPERAREIAATRMNLQRTQGQVQERDDQEKQNEFQRHVGTLSQAADAWAAEKKTSDPDWPRKEKRVTELFKLHMLESRELPKSTAAVRTLLDAKMAEVDAEMKGFAPRPTGVKPPIQPTGHSPANTSAPKTFLDVVKAASGG